MKIRGDKNMFIDKLIAQIAKGMGYKVTDCYSDHPFSTKFTLVFNETVDETIMIPHVPYISFHPSASVAEKPLPSEWTYDSSINGIRFNNYHAYVPRELAVDHERRISEKCIRGCRCSDSIAMSHVANSFRNLALLIIDEWGFASSSINHEYFTVEDQCPLIVPNLKELENTVWKYPSSDVSYEYSGFNIHSNEICFRRVGEPSDTRFTKIEELYMLATSSDELKRPCIRKKEG